MTDTPRHCEWCGREVPQDGAMVQYGRAGTGGLNVCSSCATSNIALAKITNYMRAYSAEQVGRVQWLEKRVLEVAEERNKALRELRNERTWKDTLCRHIYNIQDCVEQLMDDDDACPLLYRALREVFRAVEDAVGAVPQWYKDKRAKQVVDYAHEDAEMTGE